MKRRFIKRWTLVETVGKKPTILEHTYDPKRAIVWRAAERNLSTWAVETETIMLLSANGALPTHS